MRGWFWTTALIVLAAHPATAEELKPGWISDARTGCRLWNPDPKPQNTITWSGGCRNGLAQGQGTAQWYQGDIPSARYEGAYVDGRMQGYGIITFVVGDRYEGELRKDLANRNRYDGEWQDDKRHGHGVL